MIRLRRNYWAIGLLLALSIILSSCDQDNGQMLQGMVVDGEGIVIGLSLDTLLEERWQKDRDLFVSAAENMGAEVYVQAANGNDETQMNQAENLISLGVDILVIVPHNAEAMAPIVDKAHAAGIKVLSYDRLITNAQVDNYISFDNERVGELQAEAITMKMPKGNYIYMGGAETDNNSILLKKGAFSILQPFIDAGDIKMISTQFIKEWSPAIAQKAMMKILEANHETIDAVIAANDGVAGGVLAALEAHGVKGEVLVSGQDAELAAIRRIVEGTQSMTVYKPIKLLAEKAAEMAVKLAKGEEINSDHRVYNGESNIPSILLNPIIVDKSNINETIIADGFHMEEEVYK